MWRSLLARVYWRGEIGADVWALLACSRPTSSARSKWSPPRGATALSASLSATRSMAWNSLNVANVAVSLPSVVAQNFYYVNPHSAERQRVTQFAPLIWLAFPSLRPSLLLPQIAHNSQGPHKIASRDPCATIKGAQMVRGARAKGGQGGSRVPFRLGLGCGSG